MNEQKVGKEEIAVNEPSHASPAPSLKPRFWAWQDGQPEASSQELKAKYQNLRAHGIEGVFLSGGIIEPEFQAVKEAGLELHPWIWTTNRWDAWIRDNHPDWYMVNRTGQSCFDHPPYVPHYRWVSPVIPGFVSYLKEQIDRFASHEAVDGIHLDYVRYPDVILPRGLWERYGLDQTEELPEFDFDYGIHARKAFQTQFGRDPLEIKNPATDQDWLHFRYNSVTHLVCDLQNSAIRHQKPTSAAVFPTPRMARSMVRQDWDKWPLQGAFPMVYASFYNAGVEWIGERITENIQAVTFPVYAGLYMPDFNDPAEFGRALNLCQRRGAKGVSLFGQVSDANWAQFELNRW